MKRPITLPRRTQSPRPTTTPKSFAASSNAWAKSSQAFARLDGVLRGLRLLNARLLSGSSPGSPESTAMPSTSSGTPLKLLPASSPGRPLRLVAISKPSDAERG